MSRSSAPLALSVVKVTHPGDVTRTLAAMREFDNANVGFSHDFTWSIMPTALRGILDPARVADSIPNRHKRVIKCVEGLFRFGKDNPKDAKAFADFPDAGLRPVSTIEWGPKVIVRAKASCWYVSANGIPVIPGLQPRKDPLTEERLAVYIALMRQAFCTGDWARAETEIFDLSGDDKDGVTCSVIGERDVPRASDDLLASYVTTYIEAKRLNDETPKAKVRRPKDKGMGDLFDPL